MTNYKVYEVLWFDAQTSMSSLTVEDAKHKFKPILTRSVGYLIHETEKYIILAFTDFGKGFFKHWQVIPKGMIESRHEQKGGKHDN